MPERLKEKDMDRLRSLAGVLRRALTDATGTEPTPTKAGSNIKKLRAPAARRAKDSTP
jgi:hypothetical protein